MQLPFSSLARPEVNEAKVDDRQCAVFEQQKNT
jgi:hypothetical protein